MPQADQFLLFTGPLERAGLLYMVSGSVASMAYGEPRLTNDTDIVLLIRRMLAVSGDSIDMSFLHQWISILGVASEWSEVAGQPGPVV